jgi:arsenate reductase
MRRVFLVCVQNAGRSQMAQSLYEVRGGAALMPELAGRVPKGLTRDDAEWADLVVTMGCGDECPVVIGTEYVDWALDDPAGKSADEVRAVRDEIARRVDEL